MSQELRRRALALYTPPFHYTMGYIFDAKGRTVADNRLCEEDIAGLALRVRGWGYLTGTGGLNLPHDEAAELQDVIGELMAKALTEYWEKAA